MATPKRRRSSLNTNERETRVGDKFNSADYKMQTKEAMLRSKGKLGGIEICKVNPHRPVSFRYAA